jgi:hypothetical protein
MTPDHQEGSGRLGCDRWAAKAPGRHQVGAAPQERISAGFLAALTPDLDAVTQLEAADRFLEESRAPVAGVEEDPPGVWPVEGQYQPGDAGARPEIYGERRRGDCGGKRLAVLDVSRDRPWTEQAEVPGASE